VHTVFYKELTKTMDIQIGPKSRYFYISLVFNTPLIRGFPVRIPWQRLFPGK